MILNDLLGKAMLELISEGGGERKCLRPSAKQSQRHKGMLACCLNREMCSLSKMD